MPDFVGGAGWIQQRAVEARGDDGDVVRPTILVREIDQPLARRYQIRLFGDDARDLVLANLSREAIAAEHEHVAATNLLMRKVDLDEGLGAERLEDDVAPLALRRFLLGELARLDELLHQRLVLGDLPGDSVTHEIRAAVAHLCDVQHVAEETGNRCRRAHAAILGMARGECVDLLVGGRGRALDRAHELLGVMCVGRDPLLAHLAQHDLDGHRARNLACGGAAHAVGDHEQRAFRAERVAAHFRLERRIVGREIDDDECVLVMLARPADIRAAEDVDDDITVRISLVHREGHVSRSPRSARD